MNIDTAERLSQALHLQAKFGSINAVGAVHGQHQCQIHLRLWYRRNGTWKIISMHLTNLASDRVVTMITLAAWQASYARTMES
jgi:hypothetical protein